jgi:hypothetical protein
VSRPGKAGDVFRAIGATRRATVQQMVDDARRYATTSPDPKYVPLKVGRWMRRSRITPIVVVGVVAVRQALTGAPAAKQNAAQPVATRVGEP